MRKLIKSAVIENMNECIEFLLSNLENDVKLGKKSQNEIRMLCEEILINIINYAYENLSKGDMIVEYDFDKKTSTMTIIFSDYGIEFNPLEKKDPDITLDIIDRQIGGLGIFLIKKLADEVYYKRRDNMNSLTVKKQWR